MADLGLPEEQVEEYKAAFSKYDREQNGYIATKDLGLVLREMGITMSLSELRPMTKEADPDNSGKMDFEDFAMVVVKFVLESDEDMTEQLREAFRLYDKGNNGWIHVNDLREILRAVDDKMSEEELTGMINEIDQDASGTVDFDEFLEMMNG